VIDSETDAVLITQREYRRDKRILGFTPIEKKDKFTKDYEGYTNTPIVRLFRNNKKIFYEGRVHETVGNSLLAAKLKFIDRRDILIHHYKDEKGQDNVKDRQMTYLKIAQDMLKEDPKNAKAHYKIAGIYDMYFHDYEKCLSHLNSAYENGYNEKQCLIGIGGSLLKLNKESEAETTLIKALGKGYDEPILYFLLYRIYYNRKDFRRTKMVLEQLLKHKSIYSEEAKKVLDSLK
jgi:hypothetical protein